MRRRWATVGWVVCGVAWAVAANAGEIRPLQQRGKRLLEEGIHLSATFRLLTQEIAASDLVVYVDLNPYDDRKLDGAVQFVAAGAGTRFLKVWLRAARCDDEILATFAHELRHAVEIAEHRQVVSAVSLATFYGMAGTSDNPGRYETKAAQDVARQVAAEIRAGR